MTTSCSLTAFQELLVNYILICCSAETYTRCHKKLYTKCGVSTTEPESEATQFETEEIEAGEFEGMGSDSETRTLGNILFTSTENKRKR